MPNPLRWCDHDKHYLFRHYNEQQIFHFYVFCKWCGAMFSLDHWRSQDREIFFLFVYENEIFLHIKCHY